MEHRYLNIPIEDLKPLQEEPNFQELSQARKKWIFHKNNMLVFNITDSVQFNDFKKFTKEAQQNPNTVANIL